MNGTILRVEHLMMHFGGIKALNDVNLDSVAQLPP
jgi:branched-chain amino acid transport system ATP-binding protein